MRQFLKNSVKYSALVFVYYYWRARYIVKARTKAAEADTWTQAGAD